ncbi:MAG: discoidin domain-containing protein [Sedimentisphaerales bacterium]|nr:discoidin domain-containing protein [Sedimentisphaerales bacterium]
MSRRMVNMILPVLLAALVAGGTANGFDVNGDPSLVGWWKLDDGTGTVAVDSSPSGNDGTLMNGPVWVAGYYGGGLQFDGTNDYVDTRWTQNLPTWTISVWVISPAAPSTSGAPSGPLHRENNYQFNWNHNGGGTWAGSVAANVGGWNNASLGPLEANTWYFLAGTYDGTDLKAYTNGVLISTTSMPGTPANEGNSMKLGRHAANAQYFQGTVDDARVYNRALTDEELLEVMTGGTDPGLASAPSPVDGATDVRREVSLGWTAGAYAATHNVYLGTSFDDVNDASVADPRGVLASQGQTAATYTPSVRLAFDQTYYWRIDEVNAPPDATVFKGTTWSFTTEPVAYLIADVNATANIPPEAGSPVDKAVDGSGVSDNGGHSIVSTDMWRGLGQVGDDVNVQFAFDRIYKLDEVRIWNYNHQYEMFLGFGLKDITVEYSADGEIWTALGDYTLPQGTGQATYQATPIGFGGAAAQYVRFIVNSNYGGGGFGLSEVRFYQIPTFAREPQPQAGAVDVNPSVVLSWRPGREAASHEVHIGTDSNAVAAGETLAATVSMPSYDTSPLNLLMGEKYYWMIVEVNEAETPNAWASDVWDFNTPDFVVVDDFESYTDDEGNLIYEAWVDGFGITTNGSQVGNNDPPYAEQVNIRPGSGEQAMPFAYGQDGATTSEATLTFATPQDWTRAGASTLAIWFRGALGNTAGQLYLKVNGTRINYNGSASSLAAPVWKRWNVDIASLGAAASSVRTVTLGVSGSATGTFYVDDIRLYRDAPPATGAASDPGTATLIAYYPMSDSAADASGNNRNATAETGSSYGAGPEGYGRAIVLDGTSGHVTLPIGTLVQSSDSMTVATWVNWTGATTAGYSRLFDFGTGTAVNMWMAPNGYGGLVFAITNSGNGNESRVVASSALPRGWRHVAVTIDGATGEMNLYLDGSVVDTETTDTLPSDLGETTQNWIGRSQYTADPYFDGSLDEFRIYSRALTAGEIQYLAGDR